MSEPEENSESNQNQGTLSPEQEETLKKMRGKILFPDRSLTVELEDQTNLEQSRFWNEARKDIATCYEKLGLKFDANSVKTKEDIENNFEIIAKLRDAEKERENSKGKLPSTGTTPLTGAQTGEGQSVDNSGIPLDLRKWDSEEEMISDLKREAKSGSPESKQAQDTLNQLLLKALKRPIDVRYEGELANSQNRKKTKTQWKEEK